MLISAQQVRAIIQPSNQHSKLLLGKLIHHFKQQISFKSSSAGDEFGTLRKSSGYRRSDRKPRYGIQAEDQHKRGKTVVDEQPKLTEKLVHDEHPSLCSELPYERFVVYYNNLTKTPCWVYEYLSPKELNLIRAKRKRSKFQENRTIDSTSRATTDDYRNSGYDRGHMAAAGNHRYCQNAMNQTFLLSNILPQVGPGFNRDIWRHLEEGVRDIALLSECVHLYTGPLYVPQKSINGRTWTSHAVIGSNRVAVPTHLFKTVLVVVPSHKPNYRCTNFIMSFILPNRSLADSDDLENYMVTMDDIEKHSGMRFYKFLERHNMFYKEILGVRDDCAGFIDIFRAKRNLRDFHHVSSRAC